MTREGALEFLRAHQPLPPDRKLSEETIKTYDDVRKFFLAYPDKECIELFLFSFGDGSGYGVYQLVEDVIAKCDRNDVVPILGRALQTGGEGVRYWASQIATRFPDQRLLEPLSMTLADPNADTREMSVAAVEAIGGPVGRALLKTRLEVEDDEQVRRAIEEALAELDQ